MTRLKIEEMKKNCYLHRLRNSFDYNFDSVFQLADGYHMSVKNMYFAYVSLKEYSVVFFVYLDQWKLFELFILRCEIEI